MFADPAFSRSLRENPFLRSYFEEQDRLNDAAEDKSQSSSPDNPHWRVDHPDDRMRSRDFDDYDNHLDRERFSPSFNEPKRDLCIPDVPKPQLESENISDKMWRLGTDPLGPFSGLMTPGRMNRIIAIAENIKRDNELLEIKREQKLEDERLRHAQNAESNNKVVAYGSDPLSDFDGFLDPGRNKRLQALVDIASKEDESKHLIQPLSSDNKNVNSTDGGSELDLDRISDDLSEGDETHDRTSFKTKLIKNLEEINSTHKAFGKVKACIKEIYKPIDTTQINGKVGQKVAEVLNVRREATQLQCENILRGVVDKGVHIADFMNKGVNKLLDKEYSSQEFLQQNLLGHEGDSIQKLNYWAGQAMVDFIMAEALWGTAIGYGEVALAKTFDAVKKVGCEVAIHTKLTTGAIGKGLNQYIPKTAGGAAPVVHEVVNPYAKGVGAVIEKAADQVAKQLKKCPDLVTQSPELAQALNNQAQGSLPFLRQILATISTNPNSYFAQATTMKAPSGEVDPLFSETDLLANRAIQELITSNSDLSGTFKEFEQMISHLGDPLESFDHYQEFVYRTQIRKLVEDLNCPKEGISCVMEKIPKRENFAADSLEKIVKNISFAEKTLKYCLHNNVSTWVRDKLLEVSWATSKHSICDSTVEVYGQKFQDIIEKYHLDLNGKWNLVRIPKHQVTAEQYYSWVASELEKIDTEIQSGPLLEESEKQKVFLKHFETRIKTPLKANPLICFDKWYKFWKNDQVASDSLLEVQESSRITGSQNNSTPVFKLHYDLQFKHLREGQAVENFKSLVYWDYAKIIQQAEPLLGKGIPFDGKKMGDLGFKEIIKFNEICGEAYIEGLEIWVPTQYAKVHYRLNGKYHIVPFDPDSKPACEWDKYEK